MNHPILYHKGKSGALYQWRVWTEGPTIYTEYGLIDGQKQVASKTATAKNVGRSNETSPETQAEIEAKAMWTFKVERKYSKTPEDAKEQLLLPMLAHDFAKRKKKLTYPVDVQPKLDGLRCLAAPDGDSIRLLSRQGKLYEVPIIIQQLHSLRSCIGYQDSWMLDGELYVHGVGFQTLTSWVKKLRPETNNLQFHIYDVPVWNGFDTYTWKERRLLLSHLKPIIEQMGFDRLKIVRTEEVYGEEDVRSAQAQFVNGGYEGAIVRGREGQYLFGYRSADLLKVKEFMDAEFPVVGFSNGVGKFETCVIWRCKTLEGKEFNVTPVGTMEERAEMLKNGSSYIGKMLTVKYFEMTDDNVPRFPVGIAFRPDEDLP